METDHKIGTANQSSKHDHMQTTNNAMEPEVVKKETTDEFEKRKNYRILDNGKKRFVCSICHERHGSTGNMKQHLFKHHNYIGPPKYIDGFSILR